MPASMITTTARGRTIETAPEDLYKDTKGNINDNSTSKIKKIITSRKYRVVKGERSPTIGSKPHSKGDAFSVEVSPPLIFPSKSSKKEITTGIIAAVISKPIL